MNSRRSYSITSSAMAVGLAGLSVQAPLRFGIDHQFELGRERNRQVGGLVAFEDAADIDKRDVTVARRAGSVCEPVHNRQ